MPSTPAPVPPPPPAVAAAGGASPFKMGSPSCAAGTPPGGVSPFKVGAATPGTPLLAPPAGGRPAFTLLAVESINATFDGATLRPGSFQVLGELRPTFLPPYFPTAG